MQTDVVFFKFKLTWIVIYLLVVLWKLSERQYGWELLIGWELVTWCDSKLLIGWELVTWCDSKLLIGWELVTWCDSKLLIGWELVTWREWLIPAVNQITKQSSDFVKFSWRYKSCHVYIIFYCDLFEKINHYQHCLDLHLFWISHSIFSRYKITSLIRLFVKKVCLTVIYTQTLYYYVHYYVIILLPRFDCL